MNSYRVLSAGSGVTVTPTMPFPPVMASQIGNHSCCRAPRDGQKDTGAGQDVGGLMDTFPSLV